MEQVTEQLLKKYQLYLKEGKTVADKNGFISTDHCDSLLFSGLAGVSSEWPVNIDAAYRDLDDTWHRRPLSYPSCYNSQHPDVSDPQKTFKSRIKSAAKKVWFEIKETLFLQKPVKDLTTRITEILEVEFYYKESSTISRDMLMGLAWYAFVNKRLDIAQNVVNKALNNWGVMGYGSAGAINIMPGLLGTFMMIEQALGGKKRFWARFLPIGVHGKHRGYTAHLEVLHLMLRKQIRKGKLSKKERKALENYAKDQPLNALFQYSGGNIRTAKLLLLEESIFPSDRLPTTKDRKEEWIFQRNHRGLGVNALHSDWLPESSSYFRVHTGTDFIFLVALMKLENNL